MDIIHRVGIKAPPSKVYAALATTEGIAGWWTQDTTGASKPGSAIDLQFRKADSVIGTMTMKVMSLKPDQQVHWRFTAGPQEWIGTDVVFDLAEADGQTIVSFGHNNWPEARAFMSHCSMKWATFLLSLRELVETGKGRPSPHDLKIDNWN